MARTMLLAALAAAATLAQPSSGRAAELWGLEGEKAVSLDVRVVDLLCEISGPPCPPDCGGGRRQFGLVTSDGKLLPAIKGAFEFAGVSHDLKPYCGKTIQVDGLLVENPRMTMMFVQSLRERPDQPWRPSEAYKTGWEARNGDSADWYRKDPDVKAVIAKDGIFGIPGLRTTNPNVNVPELKAP